MIETYSEYINKYMVGQKLLPGEHHFVTIYLVPKIYKITGNIPDFVNPDGTKKINGDIIYQNKQIFIEVKYNKFQFTRFQYINWITNNSISNNSVNCPNYIVGISRNGIIIQKWVLFKDNYIEWIKNKNKYNVRNKKNIPVLSLEKYNILYTLSENEYFKTKDNNEKLLEKRIKEIFE